MYLSGTLVTNNGIHSIPKLFSFPLSLFSFQDVVGVLDGIGVVLEHRNSDVRIMCAGVVGWCYEGNIKLISEYCLDDLSMKM